MTEEELIKKGFNHGYELQGLDQELATSIRNCLINLDSNSYRVGYENGMQEKLLESRLLLSKHDQEREMR